MQAGYEAAKKLLADNRDALDEIAEFLIDKETISGEEFMEIFNRVRENRNRSDEAEAHEEPDEGSTADESGKEE